MSVTGWVQCPGSFRGTLSSSAKVDREQARMGGSSDCLGMFVLWGGSGAACHVSSKPGERALDGSPSPWRHSLYGFEAAGDF